ncbi:NADPH:quinone reductase and related Zn-dependent oxidoreductase [Rubrobacter radiotolerans]|uniref:NADPH:quinone reductase and related Zn-dependent oxidoreductase n=2 Tax=Rubrobacter radiotolerans TaxID=42256 RepID=A0A023X0K3_RUBRA|nr:NADPH:quinone reductase and related Zn-dependent oxidoreductase [Rubrobacter radiotolerans]SMC03438.1 NADPH2:quinone reductase [Rubrobacter radiotolerans DSM 5868]
MATMRAIVVEEFGGPEVLELAEVERPEPGPGEVLVRVESAGINYADTMRRQNQYLKKQTLPFVPGSEVAGTVEALGSGVSNVSEGDRIVNLGNDGGYAEYAVVPSRTVIPVPDGLGPDEAAAIPLQGLTAYHVLKTTGRLAEGESVVVHAAAGGVGYLAVQMAKLMGAGTVIATASNQEKLNLAKDLGADVVIDYTESSWPESVKTATGGRGADVILEMVGGDFPEKNLDCLAPFGRMVVYGAASGEPSSVELFRLMRRQQTVSGFFLPWVLDDTDLLAASMGEILSWLGSGELKLNVGGRYPLSDAAKAHADLEGRKTVGKLVLNP